MLAAIAFAAFALPASADARPRRAAAPPPLLTVDMGGCRFRPEIDALVRRVHAMVPDQMPYRAGLRTRFTFGPLHGVGVAAESHPDFSGEELYFREDRAALRRLLTALGFHVDAKGDVVEAARFVNDGIQMVSVSIQAADARKRRHFPAARSWLGCGSL